MKSATCIHQKNGKKKGKQQGLPWDMMWKLNTEWYGRRVAGQKFVEWFAKILEEQGCKRSTVAPWFFYHPSWDISLEMHMDDLYGCGPEGNVRKFLEHIHQQVKMKSQVHGPGEEFTHLKRVRSLDNKGNMHIRPDPKHIQAARDILGIGGCRPANTPAVSGGTPSKKWEKEIPLDEEDAKIYRSVTGILMYLSPDRPDAQFAIRELTKSLKAPLGEDMSKLIRVVRYLHGTPDFGVKFSPGDSDVLNVYSDTDWANCKKSRTSTACAAFMANNCVQRQSSMEVLVHAVRRCSTNKFWNFMDCQLNWKSGLTAVQPGEYSNVKAWEECVIWKQRRCGCKQHYVRSGLSFMPLAQMKIQLI